MTVWLAAAYVVVATVSAIAGYLVGHREGVLQCIDFLNDAHAVRRAVGLVTHPPLDDVARRLRTLL